MEIIKCNSLENAFKQVANAIARKMDEPKMTQENKPVPHVHQKEINEWAADPSAAWQVADKNGKWIDIPNKSPTWHPDVNYRRKPRWFDMEQDWIAKGKPPVEFRCDITIGEWVDVDSPSWGRDDIEYRFKEVSRHAELKAEWEANGRPQIQFKWRDLEPVEFMDVPENNPNWSDGCDYRIKPTPHPDADVFRALAEDGSLKIEAFAPNLAGRGNVWVEFRMPNYELRIKP